MFCSYCGNKIADDARFCSQCGSKVVSIVKAKPEAEPIEDKKELSAVQPVETVTYEPQTESASEQTAATETPAEQPVYTEPQSEQSAYTEPQPEQSVYTEPQPEQSAYTEPQSEQPVYTEPQPEQPVYTEPQPLERQTELAPPPMMPVEQQTEYSPVQEQSPERKYTLTHLLMCLASTAVFAIAAGVFAGLYFSGL